MVDHAARLPCPRVCEQARESVNEGLKRLAQHLKKPDGVLPSIVDALVDDVTNARARAKEFYELGISTENDRVLLVAARYDEMVITADIRMLELGVKAANNEQMSLDRQAHIEAYKMIKATSEVAKPIEASTANLEKLQQRQELLAAAQRISTTKDAEFKTTPEDR